VIMEILYFGVWCRPFHNYWAVPTPNIQCSAAENHLITNAVFNLTSDLAMLSVAFSLFLGNRLSWSRKLILCGVFGLGVFTILSAVLNKYYSFTHPFGSQWTYWYVRESSTAIIVANLPFTWSLLRRIFKLKAFDDNTSFRPKGYHSARTAAGRHPTYSGFRSPPSSPTPRMHSPESPTPHSPPMSMPSSPPQTPHLSMALDGTPKSKMWRNQGVFGLMDADALGVSPWDVGSDDQSMLRRDSLAVTSDTSSSMTTAPSPSARRNRNSWRLKDGDRQWDMQAGMKTPYLDLALSPVSGNEEKLVEEKDEEKSEEAVVDEKFSDKEMV
jgi:rhodopsin domain-containing protein